MSTALSVRCTGVPGSPINNFYRNLLNYVSLNEFFLWKGCTCSVDCATGVFIPTADVTAPKAFPILVLDNLDKSTLPGALLDLLKGLEHRGSQQPIPLSPPQGSGQFHLHPECIVIGTMDKNRYRILHVGIKVPKNL